MTQSLNAKRRRGLWREFTRQKESFHFSLFSSILILLIWGKGKKNPLSTLFNAVSLQHAAQTGRGRVFLGISSWQHTEALPTCANAQKSVWILGASRMLWEESLLHQAPLEPLKPHTELRLLSRSTSDELFEFSHCYQSRVNSSLNSVHYSWKIARWGEQGEGNKVRRTRWTTCPGTAANLHSDTWGELQLPGSLFKIILFALVSPFGPFW